MRHGSAHDAQKNRTDTRLRSEERIDWNSADEVMSFKFSGVGVWISATTIMNATDMSMGDAVLVEGVVYRSRLEVTALSALFV